MGDQAHCNTFRNSQGITPLSIGNKRENLRQHKPSKKDPEEKYAVVSLRISNESAEG